MSSLTIPPPSFLSLPAEIRAKIYTFLFTAAVPLRIEPANPGYQDDYDVDSDRDTSSPTKWQARMSPLQFCRPAYLSQPISPSDWGLGLSSQLLVVCKQTYNEGLPILYSVNTFDCSMRSALTILTRIIPTANVARIRHLILDWEQLQDFAWSLAKDDQVHATRGLTELQVNHFRTRLIRPHRPAIEQLMGISTSLPRLNLADTNTWLYEDTRPYERQLHQSALEICQKHAQLRYVLQATSQKSQPRGYQREEVPEGGDRYALSRPIPELKVTARIRWRFVTEKGLRTMREDEVVLDLLSELAALDDSHAVQ